MANKVILAGNVGKEPEIKTVGDGKKVASLRLATREGKDKTTWHNVEVWEKQAEVVEKYVKSGDRIYVEGRLDYHDYEKDGQKHVFTKVIASFVELMGGKPGEPGDKTGEAGVSSEAAE